MTSDTTQGLDEIIGTVFDTEIVIATGKSTGIKRIRTISGGSIVAGDKDTYPHPNKNSFKQAILQWVNDEVIGKDVECDGTCDDGAHKAEQRRINEQRALLEQHGHGGDNWRRLVESELAGLDEGGR
ncbi:MAG: hypothetical protein WA972_05755 [Rhodococcus qingshengii]